MPTTSKLGAVTYADADPFHFTEDAILDVGRTSKWSPEWIGGWNHPRDQQMCMLTARVGPQKNAPT